TCVGPPGTYIDFHIAARPAGEIDRAATVTNPTQTAVRTRNAKRPEQCWPDATQAAIQPGGFHMKLTINGQVHDLDVDPEMPLLWAIRDIVGLTGTKFGCGMAQCGACTVHQDGVAIRSCVT